jgi:hypothetical protein
MEVILIFRQLSDKEQAELISKDSSLCQVLYLPGLNLTLPLPISKIPDEIVKKSSIDLLNAIHSLGDHSINGDTVSERLSLNGIHLWHHQRFRVFFLLKNEWVINRCINHYLLDNALITCYVPNDVIIHDEEHKFLTVVRSEKADQEKNRDGFKAKRNYKALFNYSVFFVTRVLIGLFRTNHTRKKAHLVLDRSIRQKCRDINTLEPKLDNYNLSPLFDRNPKGFLIISEVETPKFNSSMPFLLHSYYFNGEGRGDWTVYGESILFRGILSFDVWRKRKQIINTFQHQATTIQQFLSELKFPVSVDKDNATTNNTNEEAFSRLFAVFQSLNQSSGFYILKYLCFQRYFKKYSFRSISAIDENSPATKCILDAARSQSIKSVGIQHGNIGNAQPAYLYTEKDRINRVMADMTIVWGNYWSDFLIEQANYPADSIKIAGQMRSDLIPVMLSRSKTFRQRYDDTSFIVLFASQPIADVNYRFQVAYDIYKCLSNYPQVKLIQKLHPGERHDVDYYNDIAKKAGNQKVEIHYDIDLYEVLTVSDLVITAFSTVGSEAVYFGKPLIIFDPLKEDLLKYVQESVAFQATDLESLNHLVSGLLDGSLTADKEKYELFIRKYAYSIDGEATTRTINLIQDI